MSTAGKRDIHSLQRDKFLLEAGLKFLYQDQIVTYLVLRDGVQGLIQAQQCSAAEFHPDLQFPPSNSDFVLVWYVYLLNTLLASHLCSIDSSWHLSPSFLLSDRLPVRSGQCPPISVCGLGVPMFPVPHLLR